MVVRPPIKRGAIIIRIVRFGAAAAAAAAVASAGTAVSTPGALCGRPRVLERERRNSLAAGRNEWNEALGSRTR